MTPTGLYENFESSFSGLAQAIKAYQDAQKNPVPDPNQPSLEELEALVMQQLSSPALQYKEYLDEKWPEVAAEVLGKSDGKAVVKIDAAVRTLNMRAGRALQQLQKGVRGESVLTEVVDSLNELYRQLGRTERAL